MDCNVNLSPILQCTSMTRKALLRWLAISWTYMELPDTTGCIQQCVARYLNPIYPWFGRYKITCNLLQKEGREGGEKSSRDVCPRGQGIEPRTFCVLSTWDSSTMPRSLLWQDRLSLPIDRLGWLRNCSVWCFWRLSHVVFFSPGGGGMEGGGVRVMYQISWQISWLIEYWTILYLIGGYQKIMYIV